MANRKSSGVSDPIELIGGGAKGEYAIEDPKAKKKARARNTSTKTVSDDVVVPPGGNIQTQFNPLAQQFDVDDRDIEFVDAVMADPYRNGTQAYMLMNPGCTSSASARVEAMRIMSHPNVRSYMKYCTDNNHTAQVVTREFVLLRLRHVADRALAATPVFDKDGQPTGEYKCDFNAANKALELLGKHQGMFKEESKVRISHDRPLVKITVASRKDITSDPVPNDHVPTE